MDRSRYPPDWEERSTRIISRDAFTCKHCGAEAGEPLPGRAVQAFVDGLFGSLLPIGRRPYFVILTAAHLDHDEDNWDVQDERLITLCQGCHLRYDAPDNHRRRRYGRTAHDNQLNLKL